MANESNNNLFFSSLLNKNRECKLVFGYKRRKEKKMDKNQNVKKLVKAKMLYDPNMGDGNFSLWVCEN